MDNRQETLEILFAFRHSGVNLQKWGYLMDYKHLFILFCLLTLSACEHFPALQNQHQKGAVSDDPSVIVFEEQEPVVVRGNDEIMSNENVIVYPVEGDLSSKHQTFPEYRGVLDNTTRGGYTVFDSSVTVFAVEGRTGRPQYLPNYSVPKYAEQYRPTQTMPTYANNGPLMPMAGQPQRVPSAPLAITPTGRRSAPVLTTYE
jgi:hypothetical protein